MTLKTFLKKIVDHYAGNNVNGAFEFLHGRQWDDQRRDSIKEEEEDTVSELWVDFIFIFVAALISETSNGCRRG